MALKLLKYVMEDNQKPCLMQLYKVLQYKDFYQILNIKRKLQLSK